jgi:hypothetical protein
MGVSPVVKQGGHCQLSVVVVIFFLILLTLQFFMFLWFVFFCLAERSLRHAGLRLSLGGGLASMEERLGIEGPKFQLNEVCFQKFVKKFLQKDAQNE